MRTAEYQAFYVSELSDNTGIKDIKRDKKYKGGFNVEGWRTRGGRGKK